MHKLTKFLAETIETAGGTTERVMPHGQRDTLIVTGGGGRKYVIRIEQIKEPDLTMLRSWDHKSKLAL